MRYLNKIVFINSAGNSIKYQEVMLDGNVHFEGTQGVGKSTFLRAILFFYNADKEKLGIPPEKKPFDLYYLPYDNSYIVYEVMRETGPFCVLVFKSQGRAAFRFFDSAFDKKFFMDNSGEVFGWEKIREAFGKDINYSIIINNYTDYRDILYGNNKEPKYRKYVLFESKQYQNIPRVIQNVFLNTKLDSSFIKETIIDSLNEEKISLDIDQYKTHLKDFESGMNDLKKWTDKDKNGENMVKAQAGSVAKLRSNIIFLEKEKTETAKHLGWALRKAENEKPGCANKRELKNKEAEALKKRLDSADESFQEKKDGLNGDIKRLKAKLKEAKDKKDEYDAMDIAGIIARISNKKSLESEIKSFITEKQILVTAFADINLRYEALLKEEENKNKEFYNQKIGEKNEAQSVFFKDKENLNQQYEVFFEEINTQNKEGLEAARELVQEKKDAINTLKNQKSEASNKRRYETEIKNLKTEIARLAEADRIADTEVIQARGKIENIRKGWDLDEQKAKNGAEAKIGKQTQIKKEANAKIAAIASKIAGWNGSLCEWLNDEIPDWEKTVGKVIDEKTVLFQQDLKPEKMPASEGGFYGVRIDLGSIKKTVKTLADYETEKTENEKTIEEANKAINQINEDLEEGLEKIKKRLNPQIKANNETIETKGFEKAANQKKSETATVSLSVFRKNAAEEQASEVKAIEAAIETATEEKIQAESKEDAFKTSVLKALESKKKEKTTAMKAAQETMDAANERIDAQLQIAKEAAEKREAQIKAEQKNAMADKGADTRRIAEIGEKISEINKELEFIENHSSQASDYNKDKRELFDREAEFKHQKEQLEKKLLAEQGKHNLQKQKKTTEIEKLNTEIGKYDAIIKGFEDDITAFEDFKRKQNQIYATVETETANFTENDKTGKSGTELIKELTDTHHEGMRMVQNLKDAVTAFAGNFEENNLFKFQTKFTVETQYFTFADSVRDFLEEDKIAQFQKRVTERFASVVGRIAKETRELRDKEEEIRKVIADINKDFSDRQFVQAIKSMELKVVQSSKTIVALLIAITEFDEKNSHRLGAANLFNPDEHTGANEKAVSYLKSLVTEMKSYKEKEAKLTLSDFFDLKFRIVENDNDSGWVEKLSSVGSDGTDVLAKAIINIMLLNVFKDKATKRQKHEFKLHCMMDEVGKLHHSNVKGVLKFANDRNILLINGSPEPSNSPDYRHTFLFEKDAKNATIIKRVVSVRNKETDNAQAQ